METIKMFSEADAKSIAVAYAEYSNLRITDLNTAEDANHAMLMIDYLAGTQDRVGLEMVPAADLAKKRARMVRLRNVYNTPICDA